jgi:hypothetical protein
MATRAEVINAHAAELEEQGVTVLPTGDPAMRSTLAFKVGHGTYRSFTLPDGRLVVITLKKIYELIGEQS